MGSGRLYVVVLPGSRLLFPYGVFFDWFLIWLWNGMGQVEDEDEILSSYRW